MPKKDTMSSDDIYRIGIDCRLAGKHHAGIGRYIKSFLQELSEHKQGSTEKRVHFVLFFYDRDQFMEIMDSTPASNEFWEESSVVYTPIKHYSFTEQRKLPKIFKDQHLDLLHVPHFNIPLWYSGKLVVTIHDLLWHEFKGPQVTTLPLWQYHIKHRMYLYTVSQAVQKAQNIFVPTNTVRDTIEHYYPQTKQKVVVTYEGVDEVFFTNSKTSHTSTRLLYVGSLYPHKNIAVVLEALTQDPTLLLDIVGTRNIFQGQVKATTEKLGIANRVQFLGSLSDQELVNSFSRYLALIQPSLSEGFGLTGLEAMAGRLHVICSDIPVFHEVYAKHALYFDPHDARSLLKNISTLKDLPTHQDQQSLREAHQHAKTYSWTKMTKQMINEYRRILNTR